MCKDCNVTPAANRRPMRRIIIWRKEWKLDLAERSSVRECAALVRWHLDLQVTR